MIDILRLWYEFPRGCFNTTESVEARSLRGDNDQCPRLLTFDPASRAGDQSALASPARATGRFTTPLSRPPLAHTPQTIAMNPGKFPQLTFHTGEDLPGGWGLVEPAEWELMDDSTGMAECMNARERER